jgi:hypothetical protein
MRKVRAHLLEIREEQWQGEVNRDQHQNQTHQQRGLPGVPDRQMKQKPWIRFLM